MIDRARASYQPLRKAPEAAEYFVATPAALSRSSICLCTSLIRNFGSWHARLLNRVRSRCGRVEVSLPSNLSSPSEPNTPASTEIDRNREIKPAAVAAGNSIRVHVGNSSLFHTQGIEARCFNIKHSKRYVRLS